MSRTCLLKCMILLATVLALNAPVRSQQRSVVTNLSLNSKTVEITLDSDTLEYSISRYPIRPESELVTVKGDTLVRGIDYRMDYGTGVLILSVMSEMQRTATVTFITEAPFNWATVRLMKGPVLWSEISPADSVGNTVENISLSQTDEDMPFSIEGIQSRGSIVRGVRFGTGEGLSLDSGLRLQLDGQLSEGIALTASMTDRNSPIQPEGNTQSLQEIDKVFIDLSGGNMGVTLGDISLDYDGSAFADYHRKLQGGKARVESDAARLSFAGAVSRGEFRTHSFMGVEGNQGPYRLTGDDGNLAVFIVAGSEKVYLDGNLLVRGETNDYVIDYSNAELTFTPYRQITEDSRIVVDYEYSDRSYNRSVIASSASANLSEEDLTITGRYIREADDRNHPIGLDFNREEIEALESAGDEDALVDGGRMVGEGKGAYVKMDEIHGSQYFYRYVGMAPDGSFNGNWNVLFTRVPKGEGDYHNRLDDSLFVNSSGNAYIDYVGPGLGAFIAKRVLSIPSTHSILDFALEAKPAERLSLASEIALSDLDRNGFSSIDNGDNKGAAFKLGGVFNSNPADVDAGLGIDMHIRRTGENFSRIDRIDEIEFDRKWSIPAGVEGTETIVEGGGQYPLGESGNINLRSGILDYEDSWRSERLELGGEKSMPLLGRLRYRIEDISSSIRDQDVSSDWLRQIGSLRRKLGFLTPNGGFEYEKKSDKDTLDTGFRFLEYNVGTGISGKRSLRSFVEYRQRDDEEMVGGVLSPRSQAITRTLGFETAGSRNFSSTIRFSRRTRRYRGVFRETRSDVKSNLIDFHSDYRPFKKALRIQADYRAAGELVAERERVYLRVEEGTGEFRYDGEIGEYVPDAMGDFILRTRQTDFYEPIIDLNTSVRLTFEPGRASRSSRRSSKKSFWKGFTSRTFLRLDEKTKEKDTAAIYYLDLSKFRRNDVTIFGAMSFEEDVFLFRSADGSSLRLRYRYLEEKNNQFVSGAEERLQRQGIFRWRNTISEALRFDIDGSRVITLRNFSSSFRRDRNVLADALGVSVSHLPTPRIELGFKLSYSWDADRQGGGDLKSRLREMELSHNYFFKSRGMLRISVAWAHVGTTPGNAPLTYEMAKGYKEGDTYRWSAGFDYRLSGNLNAALTYEARDEPFRKTRHVGTAEVRAWF